MNKIKNILLYALCVMPFLLAGCAEGLDVEEQDVAQTRVPLRLSVTGNVAVQVSEMKTRASADEVESRSLAGEDIGLFIIEDTDYDRVLAGEPLQSSYRYINLRGQVQEDGSITVGDEILYYPLRQDSKVAVVAYAPYRVGMNEESLFDGDVLSVESDQTKGEQVYENDLLRGVPTTGNPFRHVPTSSNPSPQPTSISFSHAYSRILLTLDVPYDEEAFDSVLVSLQNVPLEANIKLLQGTFEGLPESKGEIKMLAVKYEEGQVNDGRITYQSVIIVFPQSLDADNPPQFSVTLKGYPDHPTWKEVRKVTTPFKAGCEMHYAIIIDPEQEGVSGSGAGVNVGYGGVDNGGTKDPSAKPRAI